LPHRRTGDTQDGRKEGWLDNNKGEKEEREKPQTLMAARKSLSLGVVLGKEPFFVK